MTDLTAPRYQIPAAVQASQARRDTARNHARQRPCAGQGGTCRLPAKHACTKYGGAWCPTHWAALDLTTALPRKDRP